MANQRMHLICGNCGGIEASTNGEDLKAFELSPISHKDDDDEKKQHVGLSFACLNCSTMHFFSAVVQSK
ncbi:MAG: hypothetical protein ACPG5V_14685 [Vibrio cyclitrophicus]